MNSKLLLAAIVLLLILGFLGFNIMGGLTHLMLIVAVILFLIRTVQKKNDIAELDHHHDNHH